MVSKKNPASNSNIFIYVAVLIIIVVLAAVFSFSVKQETTEIADQKTLKRFANYDELNNFVKESRDNQGGYYGGYGFGVASVGAMRTGQEVMTTSVPDNAESSSSKSSDYSTTNIQVEGVDEPDFVKNDGKYIYTITGNKVVITDAYPAVDAHVVSTIESSEGANPTEIFINDNKLVVFGYVNVVYETSEVIPEGVRKAIPEMVAPPDYYPYRYTQQVFARVYDVTDHANPVLVRNFTIDGNYVDSRMIGDYVYVIVSASVMYNNGEVIMPRIAGAEISPSVYYFDVPVSSYTFTNIVSVNVKDDAQQINSKTFMLDYSNSIYASQGNIYISYMKTPDHVYILEKIMNDVIVPAVPADIGNEIKNILSSSEPYNQKMQQIYEKLSDWYNVLSEEEKTAFAERSEQNMAAVQSEINREYEKTIIHKIEISEGSIEYKKAGEIFGYILNQFSMDEYNGNFRAATTTHEYYSREQVSKNHIFVLDSDMNVVGSLQDLAPGETIYSARFIGNRAYMVTFKKIDPFFVIDLSDPTNPTALGVLKIPGYSDYLHPYDENHIIGLGKETVEAESGRNFAWYQGIKMSLFDVTDVANPKEVAKVSIGDRGTNSEALYDHKAFLFSPSKHLLVIPISLAEINESQYPQGVPDYAYGTTVWQGAYVFELTTENGFVLKGRISHDTNPENNGDYYYYDYGAQIRRSLYMDDVLYTVSDAMIKANNLNDMSELKIIELPYEYTYYGYGYPEQMPDPMPMPI